MILIVESGATKSHWAIVDKSGYKSAFKMGGINPLVNPESLKIIDEAFSQNELDPKQVYYYGAGTGTHEARNSISQRFNNFTDGKILVQSDILGAARSLSDNHESIVSILGTGSNTAIFDGENIVQKSSAPGYLIGDFGSGYHLGKIILRDYFYKRMSAGDRELLEGQFQFSEAEFKNTIYKSSRPNFRIASFSHFLNICSDEHKDICLHEAFDEFFKFQINPLDGSRKYTLNFTGSIAARFSEALEQCANDQGYEIAEISADPMEGLIRFHLQNEIHE